MYDFETIQSLASKGQYYMEYMENIYFRDLSLWNILTKENYNILYKRLKNGENILLLDYNGYLLNLFLVDGIIVSKCFELKNLIIVNSSWDISYAIERLRYIEVFNKSIDTIIKTNNSLLLLGEKID